MLTTPDTVLEPIKTPPILDHSKDFDLPLKLDQLPRPAAYHVLPDGRIGGSPAGKSYCDRSTRLFIPTYGIQISENSA